MLSHSLSAATNIIGVLAEGLYHLIPNKAVRHQHPRLMDIKILAAGFHCAKRINNESVDYKCVLPNKNSAGKIDINGEVAQILFDSLSLNQEYKENLSDSISCTADDHADIIVHHCVITP